MRVRILLSAQLKNANCRKSLVAINNKRDQNFRVYRKFRVLNLRGSTPTAKLSENKTRAKISGSTVVSTRSV